MNKYFWVFVVFLLLGCAVAFAAGSMVTTTSSGEMVGYAANIQSVTLWAGTDGQTAIIYNGTGSSREFLVKLGGTNGQLLYHVDYPDGIRMADGIYAVCSWSGTGTSNPVITVGLKD